MEEVDVFAHIVEQYHNPELTDKVPEEVIESFRNRLPPALIDFWIQYGWCNLKNNYYWICDPRPFDILLQSIFRGDLEFKPEDMSVVAYTVFNNLKVWHRAGRTVLIDMEKSEVTFQSLKSTIKPETGSSYSHDFLVGCLINDEMITDTEYFDMACDILGRPVYGECFAYVPALQLGGQEDIENLRRVRLLEHIEFLVQLGPLRLVELTGSRPGFSLGQVRPIRLIGRR